MNCPWVMKNEQLKLSMLGFPTNFAEKHSVISSETFNSS